MTLRDRCICALVCKSWAEAAVAATHSIILEHKTQDLSGFQLWLERHGNRLEVLQLHACCKAALTALPCCAKLQDLLLHGLPDRCVSIASRMWGDIACATKLTSISVSYVQTASQQANVVAALTALPNLEQLTWCDVSCSGKQVLSDSLLLQQMTRLTSLYLWGVTAAALQHLCSLTKLQHLSICAADDWAAADCPGLQELKALTSLKLYMDELPASASQLTALLQLELQTATPIILNQLSVLTGLTHLFVREVTDLSPESPPLKLPGLQHLDLQVYYNPITPAFLASCTQLQWLRLSCFDLIGPGSLVASTMLQHLELEYCCISAADGAADPWSWQQVFPGPGQLPHLTHLQLWPDHHQFQYEPALEQADMDNLVECCSNLKVLDLDTLHDCFVPALARLPGLTGLCLNTISDEQCRAMAQLTGLRQLMVKAPEDADFDLDDDEPRKMSVVGLRQLAALSQLTSLGFGEFYYRGEPLDDWAQHLMNDNLPDCEYAIINRAPSGSPSDVSPRLTDMCDVVDACEGLSIEAVTAAAAEMKLSGPAGPSGAGRPKPPTAQALLVAAAALKAKALALKAT